jgi:hypothetical protein
MLRQHFLAAFSALSAITLVFIGVAWDRREPFTAGFGTLVPDTAIRGEVITVARPVTWHRRCEGYISRELVGSDKRVRPYIKESIRVPVRLGFDTVVNKFVISDDVPTGETVYRSIVRFEKCGITSRISPLTVDLPPISFDIVSQR